MAGYNWWLEYNVALFRDTEAARQQLRESGSHINGNVAGADSGTCYYQLTDREFNQLYPCLTLKELLIQNRGMRRRR